MANNVAGTQCPICCDQKESRAELEILSGSKLLSVTLCISCKSYLVDLAKFVKEV